MKMIRRGLLLGLISLSPWMADGQGAAEQPKTGNQRWDIASDLQKTLALGMEKWSNSTFGLKRTSPGEVGSLLETSDLAGVAGSAPYMAAIKSGQLSFPATFGGFSLSSFSSHQKALMLMACMGGFGALIPGSKGLKCLVAAGIAVAAVTALMQNQAFMTKAKSVCTKFCSLFKKKPNTATSGQAAAGATAGQSAASAKQNNNATTSGQSGGATSGQSGGEGPGSDLSRASPEQADAKDFQSAYEKLKNYNATVKDLYNDLKAKCPSILNNISPAGIKKAAPTEQAAVKNFVESSARKVADLKAEEPQLASPAFHTLLNSAPAEQKEGVELQRKLYQEGQDDGKPTTDMRKDMTTLEEKYEVVKDDLNAGSPKPS